MEARLKKEDCQKILNVSRETMDKFDKEEKIVNTLTNGLMNVFVDNPWLMEYIKEQIDKEYGKSSSQTE